MKTIAYIQFLITISSENVNLNMSAVFIASVFKKENPVSTWTSSTEVANIWQPKLSLDDLESHRHRITELHEIQVQAIFVAI